MPPIDEEDIRYNESVTDLKELLCGVVDEFASYPASDINLARMLSALGTVILTHATKQKMVVTVEKITVNQHPDEQLKHSGKSVSS